MGSSGRAFAYWIYELPGPADLSARGNFIFARIDEDGSWLPVFIGQGAIGALGIESPRLWRSILNKGATHVHFHRSGMSTARVTEVSDLLVRYRLAFVRVGDHGPWTSAPAAAYRR
jgi:hypothetical protein